MNNPNKLIIAMVVLLITILLIADFAIVTKLASRSSSEQALPTEVIEKRDLGNGWIMFTIDLNPSDMMYQTILLNEDTGEFTQLN